MSGKNRNIRHLPIHNLLINHPLPDEHPNNDHYFGEELLSNGNSLFNDNFKCDASNDSLDSILDSIHDLNTDKSSSSTVSWGVGDENDTTTILKNDLERIEKILTGQQPIPDDYDTEEYKKWLKYFPRFCIVGKSLGHSTKTNSNYDYFEEVIAIHPDKHQGEAVIESPIPRDTIKETLIDHIYNKLSKLLINTESFTVDTKKSVQNPVNSSISIDDYLKISPLSSSSSLLPQRHRRIRRGHSSKSLVSSQISSAKWLKDDTNEYTSLPFMADNQLIKDECNLFVRKNPSDINMPKSILKARLVLPPIDQFRSISATPRAAYNKYSSNLLSVNGERTKLENDRGCGKRISARRKINRRLERNKSYVVD